MSCFALIAWLGGYTDSQLFTRKHVSAGAFITKVREKLIICMQENYSCYSNQLPAALHVTCITSITRLLLALAGFEGGWLG